MGIIKNHGGALVITFTKVVLFTKFACFMCSLITPILLAIETVTDMKPEEARKPAKFTPKFTKHTKLSNMFLKTTTFKRRIIFQTKRKQSISAQNSISTKCLFSARKYFPPMHLFAEKPFSHKILQNWSFLGRL